MNFTSRFLEWVRADMFVSNNAKWEKFEKMVAEETAQRLREKKERIMERELLPKDLVEHMESGDRSDQFLEIREEIPSTMGSQMNQLQWQNQLAQSQFASSVGFLGQGLMSNSLANW